ncbi:hypothetical protein BB561_005087 [Smittium simulii]|uniref:EF-hand domain-containing protein n=1 Tax=Smittium simulii TaxID=133385 RepID=A0A2T9YCC9_9FUNG|nr:hypothetical protein BB561_005087 [Smittium simulii]
MPEYHTRQITGQNMSHSQNNRTFPHNQTSNQNINHIESSPAVQISAEYTAEINEAFNLFDTNSDGLIDYYEFKVAMRALGFDVKKQEIVQLLKDYGRENNMIDLANFTLIMAEKISRRDPEEEYRKAFRLFDSDNSGKITVESLNKVAQELGETLSIEEISSMIDEFDLDNDGGINETEFIKIMMG